MGENNSLKIIVKVGRQSKLKFSHSEVLRAIMVEDLVKLTKRYKDCHIVIIESIEESEQDALREFITGYTKEKDGINSVLFYIPDINDEITAGLADELDYEIYMELGKLYEFINKKYKVNVSTFLKDRKALSEETGDEEPEGIAAFSFGDDAVITDDITDADNIEHEEEQRRQEELARQEEELRKQEEDLKKQREEQKKREEERRKQREEEERLRKEKEKAEQLALTAAKVAKKEKQQAAETVKEKDEELERATKKISELQDSLSELRDKLSESEEKSDNLEIELKEAQHENTKVIRDIKEANTRVGELEQLIKVVKDEKQAVEKRFNELFDIEDVIEDPISLAEYDKIQAELDEYKVSIKNLESSVKKYKAELEEEKLSGVEKDASITKLNAEIQSLKGQISSGEIHKEIIEKHKRDLANLKDENNKLESKIDNLASENSELNEELSRVKAIIDVEVKHRKASKEVSQKAFESLLKSSTENERLSKELGETQKKFNSLQNNYKNSQNTMNEQAGEIETLKAKIVELEGQVREAEQRIEVSSTYSDSEIGKLKSEKVQIEAQLKLVSDRLKQKENQYNMLVEQSGMNSSGAQSVVETNKTLETLNRTLSEKLSVANANYEKMRMERDNFKTQAINFKSQSEQLNKVMKSMASTGAIDANAVAAVNSGGVLNISQIEAMLKPFRYDGSQGAAVIPVFGTGSVGITTTAMSLLFKLGMTSKVVYLDFDLVSPKGDVWFKRPPSSKQLEESTKLGVDATGLGVFYHMGMPGLVKNLNLIINHCDRTKGGQIDYISGLYTRVDDNKLLTADYSGLLNVLGKQYNYIIVDLGRIGSSAINDTIIKRFTDISLRSIAVTQCNIIEARNLRFKLDSNKIDSSKVAWLLNLCTSTSLPDKMQSCIGKCKYGMVTYDTNISIYTNTSQQYEKFSKARMTRDKFELFITNALFGR